MATSASLDMPLGQRSVAVCFPAGIDTASTAARLTPRLRSDVAPGSTSAEVRVFTATLPSSFSAATTGFAANPPSTRTSRPSSAGPLNLSFRVWPAASR